MTQSGPTVGDTASISPELEPGQMTLRQTADVLGVSSTTLRKMIRRGLLPEAEKVKTFEGRVWAIPIDAVPGIAQRLDRDIVLTDVIDVREPEVAEVASDRQEGPAAEASAVEGATFTETPEVEPAPEPTTALEAAGMGASVDIGATPEVSLADVVDSELLERLLGAKDAEAAALVKAERQRTEYESLAARQLDIEQRYSHEVDRSAELTERLHDEARARAMADARVQELRDQLQREITYAEAERYERRQAMAREALAAAEAARTRGALTWWSRRRLRSSDPSSPPGS